MPPRKAKAALSTASPPNAEDDEVGQKRGRRAATLKKAVVDEDTDEDSASAYSSEEEEKPKAKRPRGRPKANGNAAKKEKMAKITKPAKPAKAEKAESKKGGKSEETSETEEKSEEASKVDFSKKGSLKIVSWNINGIRAWLPKGGLDYLREEDPDVLCVQETKCSDDKMPEEMEAIEGYKSYFLAGDKAGYSGVGVLTKLEPLNVKYGIGIKEHDSEGRVITLEFKDFYLINAYVPNAGRGLVRLDYRMKWDKDFRNYLNELKDKKPVILTGDLNVAHEEIDLANPKTNKRNAGFTQEERDGLTALLKTGFVDTFRELYPDRKGAYTFWTYMMNARARNVGWRLDYFIVSEDFVGRIVDNEIRDKVMGSDHCPVVLHIK